MDKPQGPITVQWAFVVGVDGLGRAHLFDHEFVHLVRAKRVATLDDIYSAASQVASTSGYQFNEPSSEEYTLAFLVFQLPEGYIAASPDIFEDFVVLDGPSYTQVKGAMSVVQMQITAQRTADMAAQVAVSATLSVLNAGVKAANKAEGKSEGGLFVA